MSEAESIRVLFVCTHNSARSQMAEGLLRARGGDRFEAFSAGVEPGTLHPLAVRAMAEIGVDIGGQRPQPVQDYLDQPLDAVITVCDQAAESCPVFPGRIVRLHWSIADPAAVEGPDEGRLAAFRAARDELLDRVDALILERT